MNLLLIAPEEVTPDGFARLSGRRARHLKGILGVVPGERVRAAVLGNERGHATVLAVRDDEVTLEVSVGPAVVGGEIDVVVAVPRPKVIPRMLFALASLGVRRVDLVNAWKVDRSYLSSPKLTAECMREQLWLGCEQGAQSRLPMLAVHHFFAGFVHHTLRRRMLDENPLAFVCHVEGGMGLEAAWSQAPRHGAAPNPSHGTAGASPPVCVAIGPEGGWVDRELETFAELGFAAVHLVSGILRVDTACVAAVAQLELLARCARSNCKEAAHNSPSGARDSLLRSPPE